MQNDIKTKWALVVAWGGAAHRFSDRASGMEVTIRKMPRWESMRTRRKIIRVAFENLP